jgi:hypothetical protein
MRSIRLLLTALVLVLLAGCAGGPPKRVFPPQVSVQELRFEADGRWTTQLRIRNFSTVSMRFSRLQGALTIAGQEAAAFDFDPGLSVGPGSTELVQHSFLPAPAAKAALESAIAAGRGARYRVAGEIRSSDPGTTDRYEYESALDPVPGLSGVLR